ncbi:MAG: TonB-dependent receptor, partial [Deinococcales bacterium]|nr:TonB-dependent receptor [Chitinophagaceae bacterium]
MKLFQTALLFVFQLICISAISQTGSVKGIVKDANGLPLVGASVTVSDKKGTLTDASGNYNLSLAAGTYKLTISFVGFTNFQEAITISAGITVEKSVTLQSAQNLNEITVGSRSRLPRTITSTPVPVDIITMSEVKNFAQLDVSQMLTYAAPSFQSARQTVTDGTDHIDPAGLRNLGPDQTLVLLNGKRRHTTALVNINGSVGRGSVGTDLNAIPASAIERIEVLRDGAAAQYGSDAIAGVINIVLKKKYRGFNASITTGQNYTKMPTHSDSKNITDGATTQLDFSGGMYNNKGGYLTVSGQILRRDKTNRSGEDNIPLLYFGNGGAFPATPSGVSALDYRRYLIDIDKTFVTQRGYDRHNMIAGNSSADNMGIFINGGFPVSKKIDFYATFGVSERKGAATGNARIPNAITQMPVTSNGLPIYFDGFLPEIQTRITDASSILGLTGNFNNWHIDLSNTGGMNGIVYGVANSGNATLPAGTSPSSFDAGEVRFYQNITNLDIAKTFDFGTKNSLNLGFGGEYRTETFKIEAGESNSYIAGTRTSATAFVPAFPGVPGSGQTLTATTSPGSQVFPGFQPGDAVNAKRNIKAGYVDLEYTLGKLLLGGAARYESYQESVATYNGTGLKLTGRYEFNDKFAIRSSVST